MKKKIILDIFLIVFLILIISFVWRFIPKTLIRSDGFMHMLPYGQELSLGNLVLGGGLAGKVLFNLFGINITGYLWFEVGIILLIYVLFYILVRILTRSSTIAFVAAIISGVSYFGNMGMYGAHCYCFFLERVVGMPIILLNLVELHLFLESNKFRYFILALLLFLVETKLNHLELLLVPVFLFYPFFWYVAKYGKKGIKKGVLVSMSFGLIAIFIVWIQTQTSGQGASWTFSEFLLHPGKYHYLHAMILQLTFWSQYQPVIHDFFRYEPARNITVLNATMNVPYTLALYAVVFAVLYRQLPKFRHLLLTCLLSVMAIFYLNAYVKLPEIIVADTNRYLYYPTFLLGIFWAIAIWHFFLKHKGLRPWVGIMIVLVYFILNVRLNDNLFVKYIQWGSSAEAIFSYAIQNRKALSPNTLVVVSYPEFGSQEGEFFTQAIGKGEVVYMDDETNDYAWKKRVNNFTHVIALHYDKKCRCVKELRIK